MSVLFIGVGLQINRQTKEFESHLTRTLSEDMIFSTPHASQKILFASEMAVNAMKASVKKMWFVIISEAVFNMFSYLDS